MLGVSINGSPGPGLEEPDTTPYDPLLSLKVKHPDLDENAAFMIKNDLKQQEIPSLFVIYTRL